MVIAPINRFKQRHFDRKDHIHTFKEAVTKIGQKKFSVLVYYGVAGIGKTSLRKEFPKHLEKYNHKYQQQEVIWASINLYKDQQREISTFLVTLKNELQKKHKMHFPSFEIAHAIYWKKANPEIPLRRENYLLFENDNSFDDFFGVVPIPFFSIVPASLRLLNSLPDYVRKWRTKKGEAELNEISEKEPLEIEEMLPYYFAQDLNNYLENTSKSAVFFIDTYEVLRENYSDEGYSLDNLIREELIPRLPKNVLWVLFGREALRWEEIDSEWSKYLNQYNVEPLHSIYCMKYLEKQEIKDEEIQKAIFKGSNGVPYYLELCVYVYNKIIENDEQPKPEDFGGNHKEIADRFFKFLRLDEKKALNVLSIPRFWNYDLFAYLLKEFNTGYPINDYKDLCSFSFIGKSENGERQMHQLMQECLQKTQEKKNPDSVKRIHKAIVKYYTKKLENINIKAISQEHETALTEAFYHAKESLEAEDLYNWFVTVSNSFDKAAFWKLTTPMYEEMQQILEAKLGPEHTVVAISLRNLAALYYEMGNYEKALPLYLRSLAINENVLGPQHPNFVSTLNDLVLLYYYLGAYEKAAKLFTKFKVDKTFADSQPLIFATTLNNFGLIFERLRAYKEAIEFFKTSLNIRETILGPQNPSIANSLNNLATVYQSMGSYEKALPLFQRALDINEAILGTEHPEVASVLNNLASLYYYLGPYEKAFPLLQRALDIREKVLGPQHKCVATTLYNLARLYQNVGSYEKALPLFQRALEIEEKALGPQHPSFASTLDSLAELYEIMGEYEKAQSLYQRMERSSNNP